MDSILFVSLIKDLATELRSRRSHDHQRLIPDDRNKKDDDVIAPDAAENIDEVDFRRK